MTQSSADHRKLAAIMFTDMVGYSSLTQRNEKLALALLDEQRNILRPFFPVYSGREIETIGDAFFVEFHSALEAVQCAVEIQKALHDRNASVPPEHSIRIRIGLHLGDVVMKEGNVHGDGVNIAARIEPLAEPGGVCISEDIARQVQNKIDLPVAKLGKGELKNIVLPMDIYRVVMPWETSHRPRLERLAFLMKQRRSRLYAGAAALVIVGLVAYALLPLVSVSRERTSIAVLPFKNIGGDQGNEYFSAGITEDITIQISKIGKLKVTPAASVARYRAREKNLREIGSELNVATILEGSVRRDGDQVRIDATLIDPYNDENLWSESYDKEGAEILEIQRDVALKIATALKARITPDENERLGRKATANLKAYDLYLKGRYHWNRRQPAEITTGIGYFNQAIAEDSSYALAYAGLADSYTLLGIFQTSPPGESYPRAIRYARRALELDDMLAEAHTSLAYAVLHYDRDWREAEKEFKRAIDLDPNYSNAFSWYGFYLAVMGRSGEAAETIRRAIMLDPRSPVIRTDAGISLYLMRRYDLAIHQLDTALALDPTFILAKLPWGGAYGQKKMFDSAFKAFGEVNLASVLSTGKPHPMPVAALAHSYAVSGKTDDALAFLELLKEMMTEKRYVAPYWMALVFAGLRDKDNALLWLEKAYQEHDASMVMLKVDPALDNLRSEPRFVRLMNQLGLTPLNPVPVSSR